MNCPACNSTKIKVTVNSQIHSCKTCGAIFGTTYLGESYGLVLPYMAKDQVAPEKLRYYDLTCLGSEGITRRHGWFDPETRLIHQVG